MVTLYHFPLCPFSRTIRLALGEYGLAADFVEEHPWDRREDFLLLNPAGTVPVLVDDDGTVVAGDGAIAEYLSETRDPGLLMPEAPRDRAEVRRLVAWFDQKFNQEVSQNLVGEKIDRRFMPREMGGGPPNAAAVRAGLANVRHHLNYVGYLARQRNWLAGEQLSYADLAAAAHLSSVDYLGHVPWEENMDARNWYARIKSRPSFRPLLCDQIRGMPPPAAYADLDF
ncbi:MAG: glutathione S-transferase family protein [Hyphomicrobiales bacterium]|nr:glutathione S-transferase family protein [Hyphomicrobiales bacterium]